MSSKKWLKIIVAGFMVRVIMSPIVSHVDLNSMADWGTRYWQYGPKDFYLSNVWSLSWPTQPPYFILLVGLSRWIYEQIVYWLIFVHEAVRFYPSIVIRWFADFGYVISLKLPAILADIGIATLIFRFLKNEKPDAAHKASTYFLFNPAVIYLSSLWGQYESVVVFLGLLSFWLLEKRRFALAGVCLFAAFYTKVSIVIWVGIFLADLVSKRPNPKQIISMVVSVILVFFLSSFMFAKDVSVIKFNQDLFSQRVAIGSKGTERLDISAFNYWSMVFAFNEETANTPLFGIAGKTWGLVATIVVNVLVIAWFLRKPSNERLSFSLFATSFGSILFLTNMHERYYFFSIVGLALMTGYYKKMIPIYILTSLVFLINLHFSWWLNHILWLHTFFKWKSQFWVRLFSFANLALGVTVTRRVFSNAVLPRLNKRRDFRQDN